MSQKDARSFLMKVGAFLGIKPLDYFAWTRVPKEDVILHGGQKYLDEHKDMLGLLRFAFPEHHWKSAAYSSTIRRRGLVVSEEITRAFILNLGKKLGAAPTDYAFWYSVPHTVILNEPGGAFHLSKYDRSRFKMFSAIFPEHEWHPWLFRKYRYLNKHVELADQVSFVKYLERELNITEPTGWYRVSRVHLDKFGLLNRFKRQSEFLNLLRAVYPNIEWDPEKMAWSNLGVSNLHSTLEELFPGDVKLSSDYLTGIGRLPIRPKVDRVRIIGNSRLIFEYQGPIAFAKQILSKPENLLVEDSADLNTLASELSFTLFNVPFWWNRERSSLLALIYQKRKDLFEKNGPLEPYTQLAASSLPISLSVSTDGMRVNQMHFRHWANNPSLVDSDL